MSWSENLGRYADRLAQNQGFANEVGLPALMYDLSTISRNDKNIFEDAFSVAASTFGAATGLASYPVRKIGSAAGRAFMKIAEGSYELGGKFIREPLSGAVLGAATGDYERAKQAQKDISLGQSTAYLIDRIYRSAAPEFLEPDNAFADPGFDIFNAQDRAKAFETPGMIRNVSATTDLIAGIYTDPLGKIAKAGGIARKGLITRPMGEVDAKTSDYLKAFFLPKPIQGLTTVSPQRLREGIEASRATGGEYYASMKWFAERDFAAIMQHPTIKASNDRTTLAHLLSEAKTTDEVVDVWLSSTFKDKEAMIRLVEKHRDMAFVFDNIGGSPRAVKQAADNIPTNGFVDDVNVLDSADVYVQKSLNDPYIRNLVTLNEKGADITKRTFGLNIQQRMATAAADRKAQRIGNFRTPKVDETGFPTMTYHQPTPYHPLFAVVTFPLRKIGEAISEKPAGYLNPNDSDSIDEIVAMSAALTRVIGDAARPINEAHISKYVADGADVQFANMRGATAASFEDMGIAAISESLGINRETADFIWSAYKNRRLTALETMRSRKFLMTNDDTILYVPYLQRQGANAIPLVDFEKYYKVLEANKDLIKSIDAAASIKDPNSKAYVAGILNDMWKASVLLRLGYTMRNVTEAGFSILARGYALAASGDILESGKAWYTNRKTNVNRLIDRYEINNGTRYASNTIRDVLGTNQAMLEADYRAVNELIESTIPKYEAAYRKGQLSREQLLEMYEAMEESSAQYLYHGSTVPFKQIDNTRPLAMTATAATAENYAYRGLPTISVSDLYRRKFGRAVPIPKRVLPRVTEERPEPIKFSPQMREIAAELKDGLINSIRNGNKVEVLNTRTGKWTSINPANYSIPKIIQSEFRIAKPGYNPQTIGARVFGQELNLASWSGVGGNPGLKDFPELLEILKVRGFSSAGAEGRTQGYITFKRFAATQGWKGKEKEILEWMRANGYSKIELPDSKINGRKTILVDPDMIEIMGQKPGLTIAQKRARAQFETAQFLSDPSRLASLIDMTVAQGGATLKLSGEVPAEGVSVAIRGATFKFKADLLEQNPENLVNQLDNYINQNVDKFEDANYFGTWIEEENGIQYVFAEPTNVVDRTTAIRLGVLRNQKGVYDVGKDEFINTKGTGDEGWYTPVGLDEIEQASIADVSQRAQAVGGEIGQAVAGLPTTPRGVVPGAAPIENIAEFLSQKAKGIAENKRTQNELLEILDARLMQEKGLTKPKAASGKGTRTFTLRDGTSYSYPDAREGELGQIFFQRYSADQTYKSFVDSPFQAFLGDAGFLEDIVKSTDPQYFSGWANMLNTLFRSPVDDNIDPLIAQFLDGKTPEQVVNWLRKTPEGKKYAVNFNIDLTAQRVPSARLNVGEDAEDFVGNLFSAYQRYLPDEQIRQAFVANQIDEMFLRNTYKDVQALPDLIGRIVPTSPVAQGIVKKIQKGIDTIFKFLGTIPETTLARHPLGKALYRSEMQNRIGINRQIKRMNTGDNKAELTIDEINGLRRDAFESARKDLNNTLFTIVRKSYAGEKLRFLFPFFTAYENTVKRWAKLSANNPAVPARFAYMTQILSNNDNFVDENGNPTDTFTTEGYLVVQTPELFIKSLPKGMEQAMRSVGGTLRLPVRSMDIIFQGEALNPGFGPVVALPVSEIVKMKPSLEEVFKPILPLGPSQDIASAVLPPALRRVWSMARQDDAWSRSFNTVYRYELIRYNLGERDDMPTFKEITKLTDSLYRVRILSNLVLPIAAQYDSELSWYTQQFRKMRETYGGEADAIFLQMYPDFAEATISASLNKTGVQASVDAFNNIQKYEDLVQQVGGSSPEMIGFIVNDPDGQYDFSAATYAWQYRNAPVPGSIDNYRERRNPTLLRRDAQIKSGWVEYRKKMDLLQHTLFSRGLNAFTENGAEDLNVYRKAVIADLAGKNQDWYADYLSTDRGKWIYRMQSINTILSNRKWVSDNANRSVVKALAGYMDTRARIARELENRKAMGLPSSIEAKANADLAGYWNVTVATLQQESLEFSNFYNRFLQNDPITIGG